MTVVSVITPTWQRHDLLMQRCIPSVREQTFPKVQHIIISDGPDPYLARMLAGGYYCQLEDHLDGEVDYGSRARNVGLRMASGDYIAYLDDDNAFRPNHLATLAAALDDNPTVDFVYSQMLTHPSGNLIGYREPQYGGIDTSLIMHRAGLPRRLGWWPEPHEITGDKHAPDWGVVERWLAGGATWMHIPTVTVDYWS